MVLLVEMCAAEKIHLAIGEESNAYDEYDEVVPSPAMLNSRPPKKRRFPHSQRYPTSFLIQEQPGEQPGSAVYPAEFTRRRGKVDTSQALRPPPDSHLNPASDHGLAAVLSPQRRCAVGTWCHGGL